MEHKVSECQISAVNYKLRITKMWGTMLQMYSGVAKLRMEWNILSLVSCPTKFLALKGHINFIQLLKGQMTNTHHIKMELVSQQRVFIGYFKVTWLLIMKLFPAKIWVGPITKSMTSEGNSALFPTTAVVRKQSMIERGVMMAFGCQPIFESHTRIWNGDFFTLCWFVPTRTCQPCGRERFQKHSDKNCLVYSPQVQHPRACVGDTFFWEPNKGSCPPTSTWHLLRWFRRQNVGNV